jgi:hypothetical protein
MVNSKFRSWYKRKVWDSATESDLRVEMVPKNWTGE